MTAKREIDTGTSYPSDFNKPDKRYYTGPNTKGSGFDKGIELTQEQAIMFAPLAIPLHITRVWTGFWFGPDVADKMMKFK